MKSPNGTWIPLVLFFAHIGALVFGLVGLLIMLPNPELWSSDPRAVRVFDWSMEYAGATHIIFGALAMFAFGVVTIGWRKTSIFAAVSYALSLASELMGTGTGWPFGNYAYTDFLGYKVLDHVPYTIPLSWFYMGFASYLLGAVLADRLVSRQRTLWSLMLGTWFLTVWDLVLDPAMAHESLRVQFWVWDETGPYFGMPVKNFIGWSVTGLLFMAISRLLWREEVRPQSVPMLFPLAVYTANVIFAMVLSAGVDLWMPILLAAVLGLIPAGVAAYRSVDVMPQHPRLARDA
ncbi:MAG TPA: carotenoid biosynthesis protein [Thermomicrobiales bacterium]|nr:carotenoid biosynthesis protein [Thermomicrobiales bacterium]